VRSLSIIEKGVSLRKASVSVFHPHKYEKEKREKRATSLLVAASPSQGTDKPPLLNPVKWAKTSAIKSRRFVGRTPLKQQKLALCREHPACLLFSLPCMLPFSHVKVVAPLSLLNFQVVGSS